MTYIDAALRQESNTSLRLGRLVLGQELELVILVFKVANVAVAIMLISIDAKGAEARWTYPFPAR
jgi:hypothetical protein